MNNKDDIISYYSNHNVKSTLKKFNITYTELKEICAEADFVKSSAQIKETYRTTRIEKYGSIQGYRKAKREALLKTNERLSLNNWVNKYNIMKENEMKNKRKEVD